MAQTGKLLLAGILLSSGAFSCLAAVENPYGTIVSRNPFRLSPPPVIKPPEPVDNTPNVNAEFEGTSTIGQETRGWFVVHEQGSPNPTFIDLAVGERRGKLEFVKFDKDNGIAIVKLGGGTMAKEVPIPIKPPLKSTVNLSMPQTLPMGGFPQQPQPAIQPFNSGIPNQGIPAPGVRMGNFNGSSTVAGGNMSTVAGGSSLPQFQPQNIPNGVNNGVVTYQNGAVPGMQPQLNTPSTVANTGLRTIPQRPVRTVGNPNVVEITENAPASIQEAHANMEALRAATANNHNYPPLPPTPR